VDRLQRDVGIQNHGGPGTLLKKFDLARNLKVVEEPEHADAIVVSDLKLPHIRMDPIDDGFVRHSTFRDRQDSKSGSPALPEGFLFGPLPRDPMAGKLRTEVE